MRRGDERRILLFDQLDALGADLADARERAALLESGGASVTTLAVTPASESRPKTARGVTVIPPGMAQAAFRRALEEETPDLVLYASARRPRFARNGGPAVMWWPTGLGADRRAPWLARLGERFGPPPADCVFAEERTPATAPPELAGSWVENAARRRSLPIWDGEIVLAPAGLEGPSGRTLLEGFASLAADGSELELVTWSHPLASVSERAQRLGVGPRVHAVGPSSRRAEGAWWPQARAVALGGDQPLAGGLVLRAMAVGVPLLLVGRDPDLARLARSLADLGCVGPLARAPRDVAAELERILERGSEIRTRIERAQSLAAQHDRSALAARLWKRLDLEGSSRAAA